MKSRLLRAASIPLLIHKAFLVLSPQLLSLHSSVPPTLPPTDLLVTSSPKKILALDTSSLGFPVFYFIILLSWSFCVEHLSQPVNSYSYLSFKINRSIIYFPYLGTIPHCIHKGFHLCAYFYYTVFYYMIDTCYMCFLFNPVSAWGTVSSIHLCISFFKLSPIAGSWLHKCLWNWSTQVRWKKSEPKSWRLQGACHHETKGFGGMWHGFNSRARISLPTHFLCYLPPLQHLNTVNSPLFFFTILWTSLMMQAVHFHIAYLSAWIYI